MPGPLDVKAKLVEASRKLTRRAAAAPSLEDDFVLGVADGHHPGGRLRRASSRRAHAADDGFLASTRVRVAMP